jgi:hypothetical protein
MAVSGLVACDEIFEGGGLKGFGKVVALRAVAAMLRQPGQLAISFYAFGNTLETQRLRHGQYGSGNGFVFAIFSQSIYKALIEFEFGQG